MNKNNSWPPLFPNPGDAPASPPPPTQILNPLHSKNLNF